MILVRDVKIEKVKPNDFQPIARYGPEYLLAHGLFEPNKEIVITREMVKGKRFRNFYGLDVVIGWDQATQTALGLPFAVFEAQEKRRESDYRENARLRKKIRELENMTLLQFIKKKIITALRG